MNRLSVAFRKGQTLHNNTTHQEHMTCMFRQLLWVLHYQIFSVQQEYKVL